MADDIVVYFVLCSSRFPVKEGGETGLFTEIKLVVHERSGAAERSVEL